MSGQLQPQHLDYFASRAVPLELALLRGCRSVSHNEAWLLGFRVPKALNQPGHSLAGVLLPVHRPDGSTSAQLRLDAPIPDPEKAGKTHRYLNLPGKPAKGLDVHPSMRDRLADPLVPRFPTEGIAKVDSMAGAGYLGLGMTGVWMGVEKLEGGGYRLHPDWELVALPGAIFFMTFDSDQMLNGEVHHALRVTSDLLKAHGCLVLFLHIPMAADGSKQGIDDYLAAGGSMAELIAGATTTLPLLEASDGERCSSPDCPERKRADYNAATLGLIHSILTDEAKPIPTRLAPLAVWLENKGNPDRLWDWTPGLAKKMGAKSANTFRAHIAPFITSEGPVVKIEGGEWIEDPNAPQGRRWADRTRYDLRFADPLQFLSAYLKVQIEEKERKTREQVEKPDPASCEHPERSTEEAEVDRCTACEKVLDIRPLKNCAVGDMPTAPPDDGSSPPSPLPNSAKFEQSEDEPPPQSPNGYGAGFRPVSFCVSADCRAPLEEGRHYYCGPCMEAFYQANPHARPSARAGAA
jgi:hypothetical protein